MKYYYYYSHSKDIPSTLCFELIFSMEISNFSTLNRITQGLLLIEEMTTSFYKEVDYNSENEIISYGPGNSTLKSFRTSSPLIIEIFTSPAWIQVFIIALGCYKPTKESLIEIKKDLKKGHGKLIELIRAINGASFALKDYWISCIKLTIDHILEEKEEELLESLNNIKKAREYLMLDFNEVEINNKEVDIDDK